MEFDATSLLDQEHALALQRLRQVYAFLLERAHQHQVEVTGEAPNPSAPTAAEAANEAEAATPPRLSA